MTLRYPDISSYQAGIALGGAPAVCVKATEGAGYLNPDYGPALRRAAQAGVFAFAYHFLHQGSAQEQAGWAHQHVGNSAGLMVDVEPVPSLGSRPSLGDAEAFIDAYRGLGGTVHLAYLPRWYWQQLGSPSLAGLGSRGQSLVSSDYTAYTDDPSGPGWQPYGGMTPAVWQYTDRQEFNGQPVDFNAYRGSLAQLRALVGGQAPPPPPPPAGPPWPYPAADYLGQPSPDPHCHSGYYGGVDTVNVHTWQARMDQRGWVLAADGRYGPQSEAVCREFQAEKGLAVDGKVGPVTWGASWTAPVT